VPYPDRRTARHFLTGLASPAPPAPARLQTFRILQGAGIDKGERRNRTGEELALPTNRQGREGRKNWEEGTVERRSVEAGRVSEANESTPAGKGVVRSGEVRKARVRGDATDDGEVTQAGRRGGVI
jgi:hypothetical protein